MTLEIPPKQDPKALKAELEKITAEKNALEAKKNDLNTKNSKPAGTPPKKETFTQTLNRQFAERNRNPQQKAAGTPPPETPNEAPVMELDGEEDYNLDTHDRKMIALAEARTAASAKNAQESTDRINTIAGVTKDVLEKGSAVVKNLKESGKKGLGLAGSAIANREGFGMELTGVPDEASAENLSPEQIAVRKKWQKGRETVARNQKHDEKMIQRAEERTRENAESEARVDAIADVTKQTLEKANVVIENLKHKAKEGAKFTGSAIANREGFGMEMTGVPDETNEPTVEKEPSPFTHLFGNLGEKLTETVPGFEKLSSGQQLLVMQGIQERIYATVKSEAKELHAESVKKSGFWGKIGKNITKNFQVAKNETTTLKHFKNDTDGKLTALLQAEGIAVADRITKSGLEGYLAEDKKTIITDYVGREKNLGNRGEYTKQMAGEFNEAASAMARIPKEWSFPEASRDQKKAYKEAEEKLDIARNRFLPILAADNVEQKIPDAKLEAAELVKNSETMMKTMRYLSADPQTLRKLESIGNTSAILRAFKDPLIERGLYAVGGGIGRSLLTGTLGTLAAPAVAFMAGGIRGYRRAEESIRDQSALSRNASFTRSAVSEKQAKRNALSFQKLDARLDEIRSLPVEKQAEARAKLYKEFEKTKSGKINAGMGSSERHMKRLNDTIAAINSEGLSPDAKQELLSKLKTYTDFIQTKVELGQVNFGEQKNSFSREYDLIEKLHEAQATIAVQLNNDVYEQVAEESIHNVKNTKDEEYTIKLTHDMRGLIEKMGEKNQAGVEKARKMMIFRKTVEGAILGATFAKLGGKARELAEYLGWVDSPSTTFSGESKISNGTTSEVLDSKIQAIKDSALVNPRTPGVEIPELENSSLKTMPVGRTEMFSPNERAVPGFTPRFEAEESVASIEDGGTPSTEIASTSATESIPTITSTEVKAGEGAADALLRLKNNPNLSEGQKEFFNRNLWAVAKDLRMVDPRTGGSIEVPAGATLSIEEDGSIVLADPNNPEARTLLGTVKGDGEFIKNTSDEIRYRLPKVKSIENLRTEGARMLSTENGETPFSPTEREIPNLTGEGEVSEGIERLDATNYKFSDKTLNQITRAEHRDIDRELTKFFGEDYEQSRTWKAVSKMDAQEFLERRREDFSSEYVGFYDDVTELANKLPLDPTGKNLEQYINGLYEFNERDLAFKKEIAELTREQIVKSLNSIFGDKPLNNPEWKQVGEMNAFEFFSRDRATYPEKTKLLYDNLSKLIVRVGKGPEVLPVGQRSIKNYLEYLYEMDTRKTLNAEIYN